MGRQTVKKSGPGLHCIALCLLVYLQEYLINRCDEVWWQMTFLHRHSPIIGQQIVTYPCYMVPIFTCLHSTNHRTRFEFMKHEHVPKLPRIGVVQRVLVRYNALYEQHGVNEVVTYGSISGPFQGTTHLTDATTSEQKSSRKASPSTYDCIAMVRSMLNATCVQSLFKAMTSQPDLIVWVEKSVSRDAADMRQTVENTFSRLYYEISHSKGRIPRRSMR